MATLDIIIIGLVSVLFLYGYFKGFVNQLITLLGSLLALILSIFFVQYFVDAVQSVYDVNGLVAGYVETTITDMNPAFGIAVGDQVSQLATDAIAGLGLPDILAAPITEQIVTAINNMETIPVDLSIAEILSPMISKVVVLIGASIVLFVLLSIILKIIQGILRKMVEKGAMKAIDRLLGGALGLAKAALFIVILFTLATMFITGNPMVMGLIQESEIGKWIYDNNPVPGFIAANIDFDAILATLTGGAA
jgi:uncharacterized membrane protein required for colicin V production